MSSRPWTPLLLIAALALVGCTHKHAFSADRIEKTAAVPAFQGKTVAVHLVEPDVRNEYKGSAGGHGFKIVDVHAYLQAFFSKIADGSAGIRVVNTAEPAGADIELYPKLDIVLGGALLADCTARLEMVAKNSAGQVIGQSSAEDSSTFTVMKTGGLSCEIATLNVLGPVIDNVSAAILLAGPLPAATAPTAATAAAPAADPPAAAPATGGKCAKDADCKGDRICQAGACTFPQPPAAPPPAPAAADGCGKDTDCKGNRVCQRGQCVSPAAPPAPAQAGGCAADHDCKLGRVCRAGACVSP